MQEEIKWKKRQPNEKTEFINKLEKLVNGVVTNELQSISSKIDMLMQMGLVKDDSQIQVLREKMKQIQTGIYNDTIKD
jgi:hypothetical protein